MRIIFMVLATSWMFGCASSTAYERSIASFEPIPDEASQAEREPSVQSERKNRISRTAIRRVDLLPVLDAGIGRFLQLVHTSAAMNGNRFVGFRIERLIVGNPKLKYLDIERGDIVTSVNGSSIERPSQAFKVWESLRKANAIDVAYLRDGESKKLRFDILD